MLQPISIKDTDTASSKANQLQGSPLQGLTNEFEKLLSDSAQRNIVQEISDPKNLLKGKLQTNKVFEKELKNRDPFSTEPQDFNEKRKLFDALEVESGATANSLAQVTNNDLISRNAFDGAIRADLMDTVALADVPNADRSNTAARPQRTAEIELQKQSEKKISQYTTEPQSRIGFSKEAKKAEAESNISSHSQRTWRDPRTGIELNNTAPMVESNLAAPRSEALPINTVAIPSATAQSELILPVVVQPVMVMVEKPSSSHAFLNQESSGFSTLPLSLPSTQEFVLRDLFKQRLINEDMTDAVSTNQQNAGAKEKIELGKPTSLKRSHDHLTNQTNLLLPQVHMLPQQNQALSFIPITQVQAAPVQLHSMSLASEINGLAMRGGGEVKIKIVPENLGELNIHVSNEKNTLQVRFDVSSREAHDSLMQAVPELKQMLQARNYDVGKIEIGQAPTAHPQMTFFSSPLGDFSGYSTSQSNAHASTVLDWGMNNRNDGSQQNSSGHESPWQRYQSEHEARLMNQQRNFREQQKYQQQGELA